MNNKKQMSVYAVIMAGGSGERFWPQSRSDRPKQFLKLISDTSLIRLTALRVLPMVGWERII
ncbi:MAG: sugar phosphate nucleotidyltransferase, partial [Chlamydiota bacterium]|nr:sugar phosphate nucleotidyltransferase [Chlamydiota bacterium]